MLLLTSPAGAEEKIAAIEIENSTRTPTGEIRNVLPFKEGDPFDPARLDQAVSYLKKWGRFERVEWTKRESADGVRLTLILKEGYLVSGIDLYGGYPFLSARLRRLIMIHSGDLYHPELAASQKEKLASFYERKGYAGTEVTLDPRINQERGTVDLVYRIHKGSRFRLKTVTVLGNTVFPRGYFVSKLNPLRAYERGRYRQAIEKIRKDYQKKGYLRARVRLKELGEDPDTGKIHPVLEVSEGSRVTVVLEGNRRVSRRTFKKIAPIYTEGGYSNYEVEASAQTLVDYYRRLGFQEAAVTAERKETEENKLLVRFLIHEGPQTKVKKIVIDGTDAVSDRKIKKELITRENSFSRLGPYRPKIVEEDFKNLPRILHNQGALEGEALDHRTAFNSLKDKATVTFAVHEGEVVHVREVRFTGNDHLSDRRIRRYLKVEEGDPLSPQLLERDKEQIPITYANHGFPYAVVTQETLREGNQAVLLYSIDEGQEVKIGEVLVLGNERTRQKAVEQALVLKKDDLFSYDKIIKSERSLRRTGSFKSVHIETIGLAEKEPVVHLLVKLEEYRKILLDMGVTYETDNSFTGNLTLSHVNLWGTTNRANLRLTGGRDIQRGELVFKDSNLLGSSVETSLSTHIERERRPGFETREGGGAVTALKELTSRTTLVGRYEIARTFFTDVTDSTGAAEEDHTTAKFSTSLHYDRRDSFADPRKGYVAFGGVDVSNKLFASTFDFIQPKGYFAHYLPLGGRVTLLNFFRIEGIKVLGGDRLTRDERLFLGGDYSVRGFDEDKVGAINTRAIPTGGQLLLAQTTELQIKLVKDFKLALFADHGSISGDFSDVSPATFRHSAGFGLRYMTPVGPIRLDYGIKLDRTSQFQKRDDGTVVFAKEPFGRLHFAFGYAF